MQAFFSFLLNFLRSKECQRDSRHDGAATGGRPWSLLAINRNQPGKFVAKGWFLVALRKTGDGGSGGDGGEEDDRKV